MAEETGLGSREGGEEVEIVGSSQLWRNDQLAPADPFIVADLDAGHLIVKTSEVDNIEAEINTELERNHCDPRANE